MTEIDPQLAVLAGELARVSAGRSVVCIGCPVSGWGTVAVPLALVPAPFGALPLNSYTLQLVVVRDGARALGLAGRCARARIREVWLLWPGGGALERLCEPSRGRYRRRSLILPGESLTLAALPEVRVTPLTEIAPPG